MTPDEALACLRPAANDLGDWSDLGVGTGTTTVAVTAAGPRPRH